MRAKFIKRKKLPAEALLQITSMADVFLILLVFLLKHYASTFSTLAPSAKLRLPVGSGEARLKDARRLEIARDGVFVDDKKVVSLSDFTFQSAVDDAALEDRFSKQRATGDLDASLTVLADESAPYSTLERVLASAARSGYVDLQLVVVKRE